jgi:flavin-dependent dehydrogenase
MTKIVDVVIIGAGPAGTVCGYLLKKAGVNCVIVDYATFPREKICGGGLTPKAYELLQELMPELQYDYQGVKHFKLMMDGKTLCEVDMAKELRMVRRKDFDNKLLNQFIAEGGSLLKNSFSRFEEQKDGRILVALKSGEQLLCDYLVGADGANSQVRKYVTGQRLCNTLWMEQYVEKGPNEFIFEFSSHYKKGYYYSFPNLEWDVVGMGGTYSSSDEIRSRLSQKTIRKAIPVNDATLKGAFIPVETVGSGKKHIILIGDAGGFANKLTYEGLYYAIATGRNAAKAISEGTDFAVTNCEIFRKKRKEIWMTNLFYSRLGLSLMKLGAHSPKLIKKAFEMNY